MLHVGGAGVGAGVGGSTTRIGRREPAGPASRLRRIGRMTVKMERERERARRCGSQEEKSRSVGAVSSREVGRKGRAREPLEKGCDLRRPRPALGETAPTHFQQDPRSRLELVWPWYVSTSPLSPSRELLFLRVHRDLALGPSEGSCQGPQQPPQPPPAIASPPCERGQPIARNAVEASEDQTSF